VVLANGSIAHVTPTTHPDLFWALRAGGNNFGIVTHFEVKTYPQQPLWGGNNFFLFEPADISARRTLIRPNLLHSLSQSPGKALFHLGNVAGRAVGRLVCLLGKCNTVATYMSEVEAMALESYGNDEFSQLYVSVAYQPLADNMMGTAFIAHSKPVAYPPAFQGIRRLNKVYQTPRIANISSFATEVGKLSVVGSRQFWKAFTIRANATLLEKIMDIFIEEVEEIKYVKGLLPCYVMQPIQHIAQVGASKSGYGPNSMGISPESGPLLC
jgi:hypothetical protein